MRGALKDFAAIGALALEHGAGVMQAMGEHADLTVDGRDELAVEPDHISPFIEGHCHGMPPSLHRPIVALRCGRPWAFASGANSRYGLCRSSNRVMSTPIGVPRGSGATQICKLSRRQLNNQAKICQY